MYLEEPGQQVKGRDYVHFPDPCEAAPKIMYLVLGSRSRGVRETVSTKGYQDRRAHDLQGEVKKDGLVQQTQRSSDSSLWLLEENLLFLGPNFPFRRKLPLKEP